MILFPLVGVGVVALVYAMQHTSRLQAVVSKKAAQTHIPTAIQALVLVAQASELVRVVEHVNVVNVAAAGILLAMVLATKSGTERELH